MKIPTLIGLSLIIVLVTLGAIFYYYQSVKKTTNSIVVTDLQVTNIFNNSATVVWQTTTPVTGEVIYADSDKLNKIAYDNRDHSNPQPHLIHFVTLKNLKPNTKYLYKIKNDSVSYQNTVSEFTTANTDLGEEEELNFSFMRPLKGTVLNVNLNPIDESLISLKIPGAQSLTTFSSTAGNFILPLKVVLNQNLDKLFSIPQNSPAELTIKKGNLQSEVKIVISDNSVNLPPITIGNNLDLANFKTQPINKIIFNLPTKAGLDFNTDGKINSLDLAILRDVAGKQNVGDIKNQQKFDINSDGIVDQKDIDEFSKSLVGN